MAICCILRTQSRDNAAWPGGLSRHGPAWIYSKLISDLHSAFYCPSINSHCAPVHSVNFNSTRLLFSILYSDKHPPQLFKMDRSLDEIIAERPVRSLLTPPG